MNRAFSVSSAACTTQERLAAADGRLCQDRKAGQRRLGADVCRAGSALSAGAESDTGVTGVAGVVKGVTTSYSLFSFFSLSAGLAIGLSPAAQIEPLV